MRKLFFKNPKLGFTHKFRTTKSSESPLVLGQPWAGKEEKCTITMIDECYNLIKYSV